MAEFKISIGDEAGLVVSDIAKLVVDAKADTGAGNPGGLLEVSKLVLDCVPDILSVVKDANDAAKLEIKAKPVAFGAACLVAVVNSLGL
jgi:hypothetical protein